MRNIELKEQTKIRFLLLLQQSMEPYSKAKAVPRLVFDVFRGLYPTNNLVWVALKRADFLNIFRSCKGHRRIKGHRCITHNCTIEGYGLIERRRRVELYGAIEDNR